MIATLSKLRAVTGRRSELLAVLRGVKADIAGEAGVLTFGFYTSSDDRDVVWVHDVFESERAREAHTAAPWHARMAEALGPLLAGAPERNPISVESVFIAGQWHD